MPYPNPEDLMAGPLRKFNDAAAFGQKLTVFTDTYEGRDPMEGTPEWTEDTEGTPVSGRIEQRDQVEELETTAGETVTGQFLIYLPVSAPAPIEDGLYDEETRSSEVVDEDGHRYEIQFVDNEQNGTYRCLARLK